MKQVLLLVVMIVLGAAARAGAEEPLPPGFDPSRHMRVSEVRPGMQGYGLSVFKGTAIERFDVEVLSVLKNFNPKHDVVLIRCKGANLEHTGSIAGMSGSPIFLKDDQGRERMIGAFAYGWPLMKDPVAGVQPIEYMLAIPEAKAADGAGRGVATGDGGNGAARRGQYRWSLDEAAMLPGMKQGPAAWPLAGGNDMTPNPRLGGAGEDATRLRPLATPLMTAGLSPRLLEQVGPMLSAYGLTPLQAGASGSIARDEMERTVAKLEPGSTMAVPLLTGDAEMTAIGTTTEVVGQRVLGFGHSFNDEGAISLPMGAGYIHSVIANLTTSFKIGSLTRVEGTLGADEVVGVAGRLGPAPATAPMEIRVIYDDGSRDETYRFNAALHPRFTPLLAGTALNAATTGNHDLPQYHTLDYDLSLQFANGQTIQVQNRLVNAGPMELFREVALPILVAAENPFERVMLKKVTATVRVKGEAREAKVLSVMLPREKYQPGETVKLFVAYRPFRGAEAILPVDFELPRDLPDGTYQFLVGDSENYLQEQRQLKPFRFTAENTEEVFAVLRDLTSVRHDALYVRLLRREDGVAIGRTAMPSLPSSRRQVLMGAGLSNTTPFVSTAAKTVPTPYVMDGSAEFEIVIDKQLKTETAGPRAVRAESPPAAAPKADEPRPRASAPKSEPPAIVPDGEPAH